jgi:hypothetical protein
MCDSFLEDHYGSTIYRYFGNCRSIVIPSSIVVLGSSSFRECKSLESVLFENHSRLERIEEAAFARSGLKSIEISPKVRFIQFSAFLGVFPSPISISRDNAKFRKCDSFLEDHCGLTIYRYLGNCRSIVIPSSVLILGPSCFQMCKSLESVVFENGSRLRLIEEQAFAFSGLKSIEIPATVTFIGRFAFLDVSPSSISISPQNTKFHICDSFLAIYCGFTT